jgi:methylmalonyl-CoA mutase
MTINGPAPMLLGFFMNAAIDQQCEFILKQFEKEVETKIKAIYKNKGVNRPL